MYTLYVLAEALSMFGIVGLSEGNYERNIVEMRQYMTSNNLPGAVRNKMIRYYEYKLQKCYFNGTEILNNLSENLRNETCLFSRGSQETSSSRQTWTMMNKDGVELSYLEDGDVFGICKRHLSALVMVTSDMGLIDINELYQFVTAFPEDEEFLYKLVTEKFAAYKELQQVALREEDTCLVELKMGRLLKSRRKRSLLMSYDGLVS